MKVRKSQSSRSLSSKTGWTAVWFVVFGIGAFHCYGLVRPRSDAIDSQASIATGPLPAPATPSSASPVPPGFAQRTASETSSGQRSEPEHPFELRRGDELCPFYRALWRLEQEPNSEVPVRVLHVGDSISTTDEISGHIRRVLQSRFGDGGHGFVLLGKPWKWYRHQDVLHGAQGEWRARPITSDPVGDGLYGLGGVGMESRTRGATAWVGPVQDGDFGTRVQRIDVSYLEQPLGGSFDLLVDGRVVDSVATRSPRRSVAHRAIDLSPGQSRLTLRARGDGWIRVFGAALDSGQRGVVYDAVAVNGARAQALNLMKPQAWAAEVEQRNPSLVVLMLGANEGAGDQLGVPFYRGELRKLLSTLRSSSDKRACLIVGPLDQIQRDGPRRWKPKQLPGKLTSVQREVAIENGCAFFDTLKAMGGPGSFATWLQNGLGGADLVHPTNEGGRLVGDWIAQTLLHGYDQFTKDEQRCASSVTTL